MRLPLLLLVLTGCAHQGLPMPGPLASLGHPVGHADASLALRAPAEPSAAPPLVEHGFKGARKAADGPLGSAVAQVAASFLGRSRFVVAGRTYRNDCSGLVEAIYAAAGRPLDGSSVDLFTLAQELGVVHHRKRPSPGDVAFFDNTWDKNGNGKKDDPLSHVAIVEKVDADGTITLIHRGGHGVVRIHMNLSHPDEEHASDGSPWNDGLRVDKHGRYLTGELFHAFASFWAADEPAQGKAESVASR